jgi:hypothetical protein
LGADTDRGATGVKGYIADFFWTEDAISFTQADFTPATAEPITFHSGNPSISSFSTSATSVANSGDSVTLSWSVSGETKLELLKYVGGLLSSTEDVLGLSSKSVAITETVSYKLRATNDNSAVDSASVQIQLSQGGNNMAKIAVGDVAGLVLQKSMIDSSGGLADVMHAEDPTNGAAEDKLNIVLSNLHSAQGVMSASIDTRVAAEEAALAAEIAATNADVSSVDTRAAGIEAGLASEILDRKADVDAEEASRIAADGSLETRLAAEEAALAAEIAATNADVASVDTRVAAEEVARAAADSSLELRLSNEEDALAAEIAATNADVSSVDTRAAAIEAGLAAEIAATAADFVSSDARQLSDEAALAAYVTSNDAALAAEIAATAADFVSSDARVAADEADLALLRADFEWDSANKHMLVGGYARVAFETGVASGDPMKITVTGK